MRRDSRGRRGERWRATEEKRLQLSMNSSRSRPRHSLPVGSYDARLSLLITHGQRFFSKPKVTDRGVLLLVPELWTDY